MHVCTFACSVSLSNRLTCSTLQHNDMVPTAIDHDSESEKGRPQALRRQSRRHLGRHAASAEGRARFACVHVQLKGLARLLAGLLGGEGFQIFQASGVCGGLACLLVSSGFGGLHQRTSSPLGFHMDKDLKNLHEVSCITA